MFMTFMMALKLTKCCYEQSSVASKPHHMKWRNLDMNMTYKKNSKVRWG